MDKEIKKTSNNNSSDNNNSIIKSGIFIIFKKGNIGWFNKQRIIHICDSMVSYFPFPKDSVLSEYPYLKSMKENINSVSGNINLDLNKFKENVLQFENGLMKKTTAKQKLEFKSVIIKNLTIDSKNADYNKKFKYCVVITGKPIDQANKINDNKWVLDFYSENFYLLFRQIHENIKNPLQQLKPLLPASSTNNINKNLNEIKNNQDPNTDNSNNMNNPNKNNEATNINNNNPQQNQNEKNASPEKNYKSTSPALNQQKTLGLNNNNNPNQVPNSVSEAIKNEAIKKKNEDTQTVDQSEKILFQEIYFQNLLRVHNFMLVHLNLVNIFLNENDFSNTNNNNNFFNNNLSNDYDNTNQQTKDLIKVKLRLEKNKTLIKNFIMEIEWLIFEAYSLFKNFCLGVSKKLVNEFPVENNSPKVFPLLFPAFEKVKTPKYGAFFYFLSKINVHFTLTWDKVACKSEKKNEKNILINNPNTNKNEDAKKKISTEDFSFFFNGKWKNLRKEFKNRDFFIDLISFFNSKATKLDKFLCIPMTCLIDYHGFRVYCESIVPKNENNKFFYKTNINNPQSIENYFTNATERQKYENYFKSAQEFSKEFHNLDTKRKDTNLENEINDNPDYLNNSQAINNKEKKENKSKFDIKAIENLFIANTRNLTNFYNLIVLPKNVSSSNVSSSNTNEKDSIKLINEKFERITYSYYVEVQKKVDDFIQVLRETNNFNGNNYNNNNLNQFNINQNFNTNTYNYLDDNNYNLNNNNNKKNNQNNQNNLNNNGNKLPLDLSFLDNLFENNNENSNDDSGIDNENLDNSNIIENNNNYIGSPNQFESKKSRINSARPTTANLRNNNYNNSYLAQNNNNNNNKFIEDDNNLIINDGNFDNYPENDYTSFRFLEDILDPKSSEEETTNKNFKNNYNNNINNKNIIDSSAKDRNLIYSKIFQTYAKFNKNFDFNPKKSVEYNNTYMSTITNNKSGSEANKNYIQEDIYIYPMKYNFLLNNSPEEKLFNYNNNNSSSNNNEKEKRDNSNTKHAYHYFRPEYLFYHYKLFEENAEYNRNLSEEEKNNKRKLSESFNLFLKEILMHNSSEAKSKNLDEFISYYNEKHIFYFTKSLDNLYYLPLDSEQLTEILHANGINMFCLGKVAEITNAPHVRELCIIEMIARICKRYINQFLTSRKIAALNKLYSSDKMYDPNNMLRKDNVQNNIPGSGKEKENSDFANKASFNHFMELIPINSVFKFGSPNSSEIENAINPSIKQSLKKYDLDPKSIKGLLTEPYNNENNLILNSANNQNLSANNEANLKANRPAANNQNLSLYNSNEEMKDIVKFLNILFNLVSGNPNSNSSNVNNNYNSNSNVNAGGTNNPGNSNSVNFANLGNVGATSNNSNLNPNNINIGNSNNLGANKIIGPDEIEIFDERLNHNKLWGKIIEEIKKKFYLDNEYILDMIKNKYFSMLNLFYAILRNSGIKYIGEPKHICEDMYNFSSFLEFKDSIFQVQPKIKGFKFRNFLSNRVFKNTHLNLYDEAYFFDEFKNRFPVKNFIFRNFVEQLSYSQTDFTEFSLIFLDSLNKISDKKFPVENFESIVLNTLKRFDKERNIVNAYANNKGAYEARLFQHLKHNFYKFNSILLNFYYEMNNIKAISPHLNNQTSNSNNKQDNFNKEMKNYKKKISNFFYENYYFNGIADLIFARVLYKKFIESKNDNSFLTRCINYYLSSLKILNNTLEAQNIFIANLNLEIGRLFSNQSIDILKSISFYTNAYRIYQLHKDELWEIFKMVLVDLCKLNSRMGFSQFALNYGIEYLIEYERLEKPENFRKTVDEYREIAYNCLITAESLNKVSEGLDICKKIFERKVFNKHEVSSNTRDKIENFKESLLEDEPNKFQFISKYLKFIIKDFTDDKLKNYYEWVYFYKNIFDEDGVIEGKLVKDRLDKIVSSVENGEIKDFKLYFLTLINNFHNYLSNSQSVNGNFDMLKSESDEKFRNLKYIYLIFREDIFN